MGLFNRKGREEQYAGDILLQRAIVKIQRKQDDMDKRLELLEKQREALQLVRTEHRRVC